MALSYISELEEVVDIVAQWAFETVQEVVELLSPGGRPFGMPERTDEEKIAQYLEVRGQPEKWAEWITSNADFITQKMRDSGVAEDKLLAIHPYDLAVRLAVAWSAEMEPMVEGRAK